MCATYSEELDECSSCTYPTDGVVVLIGSSVDMVKLKDTKTIELMLREDKTFCTSDNVPLFTVRNPSRYMIEEMLLWR